ncbi:MAG TPA: ligase-associated DNA damage response endonuclease PdeM [Ohtaekwangia sp.]
MTLLQPMTELTIAGENFSLHAHKAMYWKKHDALLLADLHLGKVNHFRKAGIPVPSKANDRNLEMLIELLQQVKPARLICLGDLFHSHYNQEWEVFGEVIKHFSHVSFELVLGNHDIMSELQYTRKGIIVHDELVLDQFILTHHPMEEIDAAQYNMAGHVHPGVHLRGKGRQAITLPCFYFGKNHALLPAFGMFTGLARIQPKKDDRVFAIVEDKVIDVSILGSDR